MNFRTTILLLVVAVAVGITVVIVQRKPEKPPTEPTTEKKLLDIDSADVNSLAVTNSDGTRIALQKSGTGWKLTEPVAAPAKGFEVDDLVRALTGLQTRGQVDPSKKASGGLDHPNFIVELGTKSSKTVKLAFGDRSPVGDSLYVLLNDGQKPDVVGNSIYTNLDKPASTYREMRIVSTSSNDIKQLAITHKGKTIKLEKSGDNWEITEPAKLRAESSAVTDILSSITSLDAVNFVDNPSGPSKYGLVHPRLSVWFSTGAPSTQPAPTTTPVQAAQMPGGQVLRFGIDVDVLKKNMFLSLDGKEVAVVAASNLKTFEKTTLDLRNKELVTIDPELVSSFHVSINRPATTQPTTKPAESREFALERRKIAPPVLGPALPPVEKPTTAPATGLSKPATQHAKATTAPATPATHPAATRPASKWFFSSGDHADAEEGQVTALLGTFHPLRVEKYVEPETSKGATYVLTLHTVPAKADQVARDDVFTFIDTGTRIIGTYKDAHFEVERSLIEKLNGDFKTKKPEPPAMPPSHPPFPGPGGPPPGAE
jgi:hypothetical protein